MNTSKEVLPFVFKINGLSLIQIESTPNSGLYKFIEVGDKEETHLFELNEIPKHYHSQLNPQPI